MTRSAGSRRCTSPITARETVINKAHQAFGTVGGVDCHSMRRRRVAREPSRPDVVIGDPRSGQSCAPRARTCREDNERARLFESAAQQALRRRPFHHEALMAIRRAACMPYSRNSTALI